MKIALLAPSGAGKTVYLTGLYGVLTQELSNSGYGINFDVTSRKLKGDLDKRYNRLVEHNDFGKGTEVIDTYPFSLSSPNKSGAPDEISIEIVDFPGEFLHQADETNEKEVEKTIRKLSECDGFIVLLDGDSLIQSADRQNARSLPNKVKANDVQVVLNAALERRRRRIVPELTDPNEYAFGSGVTPVVFGLTKGDKIANWLAANSEQGPEKLEGTIKKLFSLKAGSTTAYDPNEGIVANFVRSQFASIIEAPDIASLRTVVSVYDEGQQMLDPKNVEHLFQFVLFVGLYNAHNEYVVRRKAWQEEEERRKLGFDNKKEIYERAVSSREDWKDTNVLDRFFECVWNGESIERHDYWVSQRHTSMSEAAKKLDASKEFLLQVGANYSKVEELLYQILPDRFAYQLELGHGKSGYYQRNMPLGNLLYNRWQKKLAAGKLEVEQGVHSDRDLSL
jgi:hypothetical protein